MAFLSESPSNISEATLVGGLALFWKLLFRGKQALCWWGGGVQCVATVWLRQICFTHALGVCPKRPAKARVKAAALL